MWKPLKWIHKSYWSSIQKICSRRSKWTFQDRIGFSSITTSPPTINSAHRIPLKKGSRKIVLYRKRSPTSCRSCLFHCFFLRKEEKPRQYLRSTFDWYTNPFTDVIREYGSLSAQKFSSWLRSLCFLREMKY